MCFRLSQLITVPAAPHHHMELRIALELRKLQALTPYRAQVWETLLVNANLLEKYPLLPKNICSGFIINIPNIITTQTPPNKLTINEFLPQFKKIINLELFKQRYIGPFSHITTESLIGPFQTSPFSIIPKPRKPDCFHLIQNFSFPHDATSIHSNPSINSILNPDNLPTTWGTFTVISLLIYKLPPHSQIAMRDVAEAYRTIPLHHPQWPGTVMRTGEDAFCIDTMAVFGFSPSSGIYGTVAEAGANIFRYKGIGPLAKWVDDHVFFRVRLKFLESYNQQHQARHLELST